MKIHLNKYCVYYHLIGREIFYVGTGNSQRAFTWLDRTDLWLGIVRERENKTFTLKIARWFDDRKEAVRFETKEIARLKPRANREYRFYHAQLHAEIGHVRHRARILKEQRESK